MFLDVFGSAPFLDWLTVLRIISTCLLTWRNTITNFFRKNSHS